MRWHERLMERREFVHGERMIDVINSTELRVAVGWRPWKLTTIRPTPSGISIASDDEADAATWCG
jgi:hypothetical protein